MSNIIAADFEHPDDQTWLCDCGAYIEDGMHCTSCGNDPPWGCDCDICIAEADEREAEFWGDYWPTG